MGHFATQRKKNPFSEEKKTLTSKPLFSLTLSLLSFVSLLSLSSTSLCFSGGFCCWLLGVSGAARVLLETWSFWLLLLSLVCPWVLLNPTLVSLRFFPSFVVVLFSLTLFLVQFCLVGSLLLVRFLCCQGVVNCCFGSGSLLLFLYG